jgi:putative salt-induced outer membrane protein YdiY
LPEESCLGAEGFAAAEDGWGTNHGQQQQTRMNTHRMETNRWVWLSAAGLFALGGAERLQAQAPAPPAPEKKKVWEVVASAGITVTRGNSDSFMAAAGLNAVRKWSKDEALFGVNAGYGENTKHEPDNANENDVTTKSDQYIKGFGQYNHLLTEHLYVGARADAVYDEIAGIDYRVTLSPLVGYYFIKNDKTRLSGEIGPSVIFENLRSAPSTIYFGFRVGERFEHKFSEKTKMWQSADWVPQIDDLNNWVMNFEIGLATALSKSLELQVKLLDTFDNEPATVKVNSGTATERVVDRQQNDLKFITALAYKF